MSQRTIQVGYDDEGEPLKWPARYAICWACRGEGTRALHGMAITSSEMHELGDDFRDDYLSGVYDTVCRECNGDRVILEVDVDALNLDDIKRLEQAEIDEWDADAVDRSEARAFGYDR